MLKSNAFTKDYENRTVFINKMINSGIMRMFIIFYNFYIYIFCFVSQMLCICIDDRNIFSMRFFFFFVIFIWWGIGIASESKLEVLKDGWLKVINPILTLSFPLTAVFVWRWTHTREHWIISSMTSILKIVLWMFLKMCISEFDILIVIHFYLLKKNIII
jgi:hypothetical protein